MGRPRGFDEAVAVESAVRLFAARPYDGVSVDDLVAALGVHRNSLYATFGSKRGLYLRALRRAIDQAIDQAVEMGETRFSEGMFDFVLMASLERAGHDPDVAAEVARAFEALDAAHGRAGATELIGRRVRSRAGLGER